MNYVRYSFMVVFLIAHQFTAAIDVTKIAVYSAATTALSAGTYGTYKGMRWLVGQENRSYRALDNVQAALLETRALWNALGLEGDTDQIEAALPVIGAKCQNRYKKVITRVTTSQGISTVHSFTTNPAAVDSVVDAVEELQFATKALEIALLQGDYCLKNYTSSYHAQLERSIAELRAVKAHNEEITEALKMHMHGVLNAIGHSINTAFQNISHYCISKPLYKIF